MPIKAIALDIDGTLTNDEKVVTPRTREILLAAQRMGITLILASGRPIQGLRRLARELELDRYHGLLIAYNGAEVRDAASGELLFTKAISVGLSHAVLEHMKSFDVIPMLVDGDRLVVEDAYRCTIEHRGLPKNIIKYERDACDLRVYEVHSLRKWCTTPQSKILTAGTDTYLQEYSQLMALPFKSTLSCMFTADFYFEFTALGVDKGAALRGALPRRGIEPSELVAFGDGENDISMLTFAGTGVAMGNAQQHVIDAADLVTASNNDDGIALALERLLS